MQSENFDKKLKDSLSQRPPGNDNPEWDKMEWLLDKHMPVEKKERRRIFFILFGFLLLGGGAFLVWTNNNGNDKHVTSIDSHKQNTGVSENNHQEKTKTDKTVTLPISPETKTTKTGLSPEVPHSNANSPTANKDVEISSTVPKVGKNKKAIQQDQTIDELVKNTDPKRSLIDRLTKTEPEPTTMLASSE